MATNKRKRSRIIPATKPVQAYLDEEDGDIGGEESKSLAMISSTEAQKISYRSKFINSTAMASLSMALDKLKLSKDEILAAMELFVNSRTKTAEFIRIASMLKFYKEGLSIIDKKSISYEDLAERFAIDHNLFIAAVVGGLYTINLSLSKSLLANGMPDVVAAVLERAAGKKSGAFDAKLAFQVTGLLDESAKVNVGTMVNGNIGGGVNSVVGDGNSTTNLNSFKAEIMSIDDMIRESYDQGRGSSEAEVIEAEVVE